VRNDLLNLVRREVQRTLRALVADPRVAIVQSFDPARYAATVQLMPEGTQTGWLPILVDWMGNGWGSLTIATASGFTHGVVVEEVEAAIGIFIDSLPLGTLLLPISRLAQVAYDASPGITNVTGITINSVAADLALTEVQCARAGTIAVS
jgi:hypothetical protein